jgi:hypothetical protein
MATAQPISNRLNLRRLAVALGLFAVLFHVLLPITQLAVREAQAANGIDHVVLCSAHGFKTIALKNGLPVDADPAKPEQTSRNCPLCPGQAFSPAILPAGILLSMPAFSLTVLFGSAPASTLAQSPHSPQQARAPPAFHS